MGPDIMSIYIWKIKANLKFYFSLFFLPTWNCILKMTKRYIRKNKDRIFPQNKSLPWPGQTSWDLCTCSWLSARCPTSCTVWRPRWIWFGSCKCLPGTPCCHFLPASFFPFLNKILKKTMYCRITVTSALDFYWSCLSDIINYISH